MYYKVVNMDLKSAVIDISPILVEYKMNEWVSSKIPGSKLFVFNNIYTAFEFAAMLGKDVYECEVEGIYLGKNKLIAGPGGTISSDKILRFWKRFKNKKRFTNLINTQTNDKWLPYTVWVDRVKLTKRLINYD